MNLKKSFGIVLLEKVKGGIKMKIIVGGILQKGDKILMVQEAQESCYGQWNFPAGHLDDGETVLEGAVREVFEETGCKVKLTNMLPIISSKERNLVRFTFLTEILEENIQFDTSEILAVKWFTIEEIKKMTEKELRGYKIALEIIKQIEEKESLPLDIVKIK